MWKINSMNGVYLPGASYPLQKRVDIILTYISTQNYSQTALRCKVSYNCVRHLIDIFRTKSTLLAQTESNSRPKVFPWWIEMYIEALVVMFPTLYLREIQEMLVQDLNLLPRETPSINTIHSVLDKSGITRKKCVEVANERFSPLILLKRRDFVNWRKTVDPRMMYFFDETGFASDTDSRMFGRCEIGYPLPSYQSKSKTKLQSVLGVIGYREGVMSAIPIDGNYNTLLVNEVIQYQVLPLLPPNCYLVADNASIHNDVQLANILSQKNITLVKLPAYSYDLNPIEMVFGLAKAMARKTPGALTNNPLMASIDSFVNISALSVRKYYRRA